MTWAARYIGLPWVAGESDCWCFARRVWWEVFGWVVPAVDVDAMDRLASARAMTAPRMYVGWIRVDVPGEGDAVLMGKNRRAAHVGIWTEADGGGVVHSVQGVGVVFTPPQTLSGMGLNVLGYYRRA